MHKTWNDLSKKKKGEETQEWHLNTMQDPTTQNSCMHPKCWNLTTKESYFDSNQTTQTPETTSTQPKCWDRTKK